MTIWQG